MTGDHDGEDADGGGSGLDGLSKEQVGYALTAMTTEHFVLQSARAATVSEANGRVSVFLAAVSGALVALGFAAQASKFGTAFRLLALLLLPVLSYLGVVTQERVLQSGIEDAAYARRISMARRFYVDVAPGLAPYFQRPDPTAGPGVMPADSAMPMVRFQVLVTTGGMVAVITGVLAGATVGVLLGLFGLGPAVGYPVGACVAVGSAGLLLDHQRRVATAGRRPRADDMTDHT